MKKNENKISFINKIVNKSHAAAYGIIGYQTAYLMKYYPVEMIAAMLNSVMGTSEKVAHYVKFAESEGIQVIRPNVNLSHTRFTVQGDKIIFGLGAVRNVGVNVCENIVNSREKKGEYISLIDFINKVNLSAINKRAVESLIKAGAMDDFEVYRSKMLGVYEKLMDGISNEKKRNIDGQINLFGGLEEEESVPEVSYPNINEFNKRNLLSMEKEMTGLYLSGHPLDEYEKSIKMQTSIDIQSIYDSHKILQEESEKGLSDNEVLNNIKVKDNQTVIIGGILTEVNQKVTRNNTLMAFLKLEDLTNEIEIIVFPKTLDRIRGTINVDELVIIRGRISLKEDEQPKLICEKVEPLEKVNDSKIYIKAKDKDEVRKINLELKKIAEEYRGDTPIYIFDAKEKKSYRAPRECWLNLETEIVTDLRKAYSDENIKIMEK
ncbi:OB-fold nucleic acid binding domain-containing protein [uncultured Clostridium sp.]|uniref:helix-hairpin-helix domain-containing protein n=1 Tax=uncultured Clostridium sp. TaxID=59620 RepID=UPI0026082A30|nr:OB-fold nucleic acid binding domain-containing protein [uncultured Clostridium sp.]